MEGDDIGLETVPRTVTIMEAAIARELELEVTFQRYPVGWSSYLEHGHTLPQTTLDTHGSAPDIAGASPTHAP